MKDIKFELIAEWQKQMNSLINGKDGKGCFEFESDIPRLKEMVDITEKINMYMYGEDIMEVLNVRDWLENWLKENTSA